MIVKRIGVWSLAKIAGAVYGGLGLIAGAIFALASLFGAGMMPEPHEGEPMSAAFGVLFGAGAVVFVPLLYGIMGLVVGAIAAVIYNIAAGLIGGLRLETDPAEPT